MIKQGITAGIKNARDYINQYHDWFMFEFLIKVIVELLITIFLSYPGAFLRWLFVHRKKSFNHLIKEDVFINGSIGALFITAVILFFLILRTNS